MKLELEVQEADLFLPDGDFVAKGHKALRAALRTARPSLPDGHEHFGDPLNPHPPHGHDGAELRAVQDLAEGFSAAYGKRCERMLNDIAELLVEAGKTADG